MLRKYSNDVITVNYITNVFGFNLSLLTYKCVSALFCLRLVINNYEH